jgi:glucokinase
LDDNLKTTTMILCADIGGTNTRLALIDYHPAQGEPLRFHSHQQYQNIDHQNFTVILNHYLRSIDGEIEQACIAVAGPVHKNTCQITNLGWIINGDELCRSLNWKSVDLVNDLVATAFSIPHLSADDFVVLQNNYPNLAKGPIAVIGLGTGLGESVLFPVTDKSDEGYYVIGGEGGHKVFAPHNKEQLQIYQELLVDLGLPILVTEQLLSGPGLQRIYSYLFKRRAGHQESILSSPEDITIEALKNPDSIAAQAVAIVLDLLAAEAANIVLQYYSIGGLVIAGGIPPHLIKLIDQHRFQRHFQERIHFSNWLQGISLAICNNTAAPLIGAYHKFFQPQEKNTTEMNLAFV